MSMWARRGNPTVEAVPGTGVPCHEAQADGVPCIELRPDCADCDRVEAVRPEPPLAEEEENH
jgi:hypothetical protein